jgi:outer membrane protein assembly factor BamD (BamD/ComL family)
VLDEERRQSRLDELEAQLASIPDPLEEMQKQVDKTAFILVYQADRQYRELNQTDSAVENYKRVIELFPDNRWAKVARQRLSEIKNDKSNKTKRKET